MFLTAAHSFSSPEATRKMGISRGVLASESHKRMVHLLELRRYQPKRFLETMASSRIDVGVGGMPDTAMNRVLQDDDLSPLDRHHLPSYCSSMASAPEMSLSVCLECALGKREGLPAPFTRRGSAQTQRRTVGEGNTIASTVR
jgi:hypothetical protein